MGANVHPLGEMAIQTAMVELRTIHNNSMFEQLPHNSQVDPELKPVI